MAKLLKNLYNQEYITLLTSRISLSYPSFESVNFTKKVFDEKWQNRELKERMRHISTTLYEFLPDEYEKSIEILKNTFTEVNSKHALENMIFQDFVEVYGIDKFEISMEALKYFTINSSSEFAIRQFILKYPIETMREMLLWAEDENEHIRRLSSEGCRPRLPWAIALEVFKKNPNDVLKILDILKDDTSKYVQKSVANNLNDISKDNPHTLKQLAKEWIGKSKNRDWILKHGCRTLLKQGDREILELFGFKNSGDISVSLVVPNNKIDIGDTLNFSFSLESKKELGKLRVEYAINFVRQNSKSATKVFQIAQGVYKQKSREFKKHYSFKKISTRKYYPGEHELSIIVNGTTLRQKKFWLQ